MKNDKRLDRLEKYLTPKQSAIVWVDEVHKYSDILEYVKYLRDLPEALRPVPRLTAQVAQAVKEAMSGQPKNSIQAAVHQAELDVCFLIKLHHKVNEYFLTEERVWSGTFAALEAGLRVVSSEVYHARFVSNLAGIVSRELPYPLDPRTAKTVKLAILNDVTTWEYFEENAIEEWLLDYYLSLGIKQLPMEAYDYKDGKFVPNVNAQNEDELRKCFKEKAEFERFRAGLDYTKGLADVKDCEYNAHYENVVGAVRELVNSGNVQKGKLTCLESVPMPFLRCVPLINEKWLDYNVVELAELGALLDAFGYKVQETSDDHPLAWPRFVKDNGEVIDKEGMRCMRKLANKGLKSFPYCIKKIDGHLHVNFEDYCSWEGRRVKGDLHSGVSDGFKTSSWNSWVDSQDKDGCLAGVLVDRLGCYIGEDDYCVYNDEIEDRLKKRSLILGIMDKTELSDMRNEEEFWKEMAESLILKLYMFRLALSTISRNYFDDNKLLFDDSTQSLDELIEYSEEMIRSFNRKVADNKIDIETIQVIASKSTAQHISYLVDMAKADALDAMGEDKAAVDIVEQYI